MSGRRTPPASWWVRCVVHNVLVHPLLPIADLLDHLGCPVLPRIIYSAHDASAPEGGG